jgi:prenyltransferase beta subunit
MACSAGGVGATPNLRDTYPALRILAELDSLNQLDEVTAFIERLQRPSLGFKYTEGSVSDPDIDTLYAGVFSCTLLGLDIHYAGDILHTVLSCQRLHGGFAWSSDSLGNLNTHCRALSIIHQWREHESH